MTQKTYEMRKLVLGTSKESITTSSKILKELKKQQQIDCYGYPANPKIPYYHLFSHDFNFANSE